MTGWPRLALWLYDLAIVIAFALGIAAILIAMAEPDTIKALAISWLVGAPTLLLFVGLMKGRPNHG